MNKYSTRFPKVKLTEFSAGIDRLIQSASSPVAFMFNEARADFYKFVMAVGRDERGNQLTSDHYTNVFCRLLTECRNEGLHVSHVAPPGLGKSTLARLFLLWCIGRDHNLRTIIVSGDTTVSGNSVSLCRDIILTDNYKTVFPEVRPDVGKSGDKARGWRQNEFFLTTEGEAQIADPTLAAVSMEPIAENRRVDIGLFDDYITRTVVHSPTLKAKGESVFFQTWLDGRMAHGGWMLFVSNCWTTEDLGHKLRADTRFCSFWVGLNADGTRIFLRLWNPPKNVEYLNEFPRVIPQMGADVEYELPLPNGRKAFTESAIAARIANSEATHRQLYQLIASGPGDRIMPNFVNRAKHDCTVTQLLQCDEEGGLPKFNYLDRMRYALVAGIDLSGLGRQGTAFWVLAIDGSGKVYPVEHDRGAWTVTQIVERIQQSWARGIQPIKIIVETNGIQELIMESIGKVAGSEGYEWARLLQSFVTGSNKWNPQLGLPGLDVDFEQGIVQWPARESSRMEFEHSAAWRIFETQGAQMTNDVARKSMPDGWMAYWFARTGLRGVGVGGHGKPISVKINSGRTLY